VTFAWERVKADPGTILATVVVGTILVWVVSFVTGIVASVGAGVGFSATGSHGFDTWTPLFVGLRGLGWMVNWVVGSFVLAGITNFSLKVARGAPYSFNDLFGGAPYFVSVLVAYLVYMVAVIVGLALLVVPGVIVALGLMMTFPVIIDRNLGPIEGLTESWRITDGQKTNLFVFSLIAFGLIVAGACACGIGMFLVMPILYIAQMYIYLKLTGQPVAVINQARPQGANY
jgi:uncharacterized membrane protein